VFCNLVESTQDSSEFFCTVATAAACPVSKNFRKADLVSFDFSVASSAALTQSGIQAAIASAGSLSTDLVAAIQAALAASDVEALTSLATQITGVGEITVNSVGAPPGSSGSSTFTLSTILFAVVTAWMVAMRGF